MNTLIKCLKKWETQKVFWLCKWWCDRRKRKKGTKYWDRKTAWINFFWTWFAIEWFSALHNNTINVFYCMYDTCNHTCKIVMYFFLVYLLKKSEKFFLSFSLSLVFWFLFFFWQTAKDKQPMTGYKPQTDFYRSQDQTIQIINFLGKVNKQQSKNTSKIFNGKLFNFFIFHFCFFCYNLKKKKQKDFNFFFPATILQRCSSTNI